MATLKRIIYLAINRTKLNIKELKLRYREYKLEIREHKVARKEKEQKQRILALITYYQEELDSIEEVTSHHKECIQLLLEKKKEYGNFLEELKEALKSIEEMRPSEVV